MEMVCADCNKNNPADTVMATFIYSDLSCYIRCMTWHTYGHAWLGLRLNAISIVYILLLIILK